MVNGTPVAWKSTTVQLETPVAKLGGADGEMLRELTLKEPTALMLEEIEQLGVANPDLSVKVTIGVLALMSGLDREQIAGLSARDLLKVGAAANPLLPTPMVAEGQA